jgi:hypothetical protein
VDREVLVTDIRLVTPEGLALDKAPEKRYNGKTIKDSENDKTALSGKAAV